MWGPLEGGFSLATNLDPAALVSLFLRSSLGVYQKPSASLELCSSPLLQCYVQLPWYVQQANMSLSLLQLTMSAPLAAIQETLEYLGDMDPETLSAIQKG